MFTQASPVLFQNNDAKKLALNAFSENLKKSKYWFSLPKNLARNLIELQPNINEDLTYSIPLVLHLSSNLSKYNFSLTYNDFLKNIIVHIDFHYSYDFSSSQVHIKEISEDAGSEHIFTSLENLLIHYFPELAMQIRLDAFDKELVANDHWNKGNLSKDQIRLEFSKRLQSNSNSPIFLLRRSEREKNPNNFVIDYYDFHDQKFKSKIFYFSYNMEDQKIHIAHKIQGGNKEFLSLAEVLEFMKPFVQPASSLQFAPNFHPRFNLLPTSNHGLPTIPEQGTPPLPPLPSIADFEKFMSPRQPLEPARTFGKK